MLTSLYRSTATTSIRFSRSQTTPSLIRYHCVLSNTRFKPQITALRPFHSTSRPLQSSLSSRISQRVWYRKDGTSRSKVRGAIYTLIGSVAVLTGIAALEVMEDLQELVLQLAAMLQVQRVDFEEYSTIDFSDYRQTTQYFESLAKPFLITAQYSDEASVALFFKHVLEMDDATAAVVKERIHSCMKATAEQVHELLRGIGDEPLDSFQDITRLMREALLEVATDMMVETDDRLAALLKVFKDKDDSGKPPPSKGRGYELIG
ncbi:hypothetical protein E1B28_001964 [Marasmius oreades]|uniref:Uncharacterized protein n=1 Tax=Marasmius oreades TaxID=181124 RepID=A0A9P7V4P1_9AGAR|nr:uncharacterized protein E1B28_001964 [Marasmius oreades]KAG7100187.1 hypothetical protein E1B28_001964 [Marasmius oreades]